MYFATGNSRGIVDVKMPWLCDAAGNITNTQVQIREIMAGQ